MKEKQSHSLCVAPMMDWTDRHCRYFHRLISPSALLYTEMVTTGAILHGDRKRLLDYNPEEHLLALQLGGGDTTELAKSAVVAQSWGYDEINLNVGCPSDRVQRGKIGACLMLEPETVKDCYSAMASAVDIPVTIKCRLGVDDHDSYGYFRDFIATVAEGGCKVFIIHARKAWLTGLSPKQNRDIPPLKYDWVYRLKKEMPNLMISINGGITDIPAIKEHLQHVDGVMLGRAAYHTPWLLNDCEIELFDETHRRERAEIVHAMTQYLSRQVEQGVPVKSISRHMLGLFQGLPGAKRWRRWISENAHRDNSNVYLLEQALEHMKLDAA